MTYSIDIAKKVLTKDSDGQENGWIMELYKDHDKTAVYVTTISLGKTKGYHYHQRERAQYVVLKGSIKIIMYTWNTDRWNREEVLLYPQDKISIAPHTATAIENVGAEDAYLINCPSPAYDPNDKDEQVKYTLGEIENGVFK